NGAGLQILRSAVREKYCNGLKQCKAESFFFEKTGFNTHDTSCPEEMETLHFAAMPSVGRRSVLSDVDDELFTNWSTKYVQTSLRVFKI
ncbi:MAG: hypothetical protein ABR572_13570, partial [Cryomorphaceae bacterium]